MKITSRVLIVCRKTQQVLLWTKVKSHLLSAPGGTQDPPDKSIYHTIARELREETRIRRSPTKFKKKGWVRIYKKYPYQEYLLTKMVYLFILEVDSCTLRTPDTEEMIGARWFHYHRFPYKQMAPYYHVWSLKVLQGDMICADIFLDEKSQVVHFYEMEPDQEASAPPYPLKKR